MLEQAWRQQLMTQQQENLYRQQQTMDYHTSTKVHDQNRTYLSFASNNYLGLAQHPNVIKACQTALNRGVGSGSAYLISGYTSAHQRLEEKLADFLGFERVLMFTCGYMANIGIIKALFSNGDTIIGDKLNHASLVDGCLASRATFKRYPHHNLQRLDTLCSNAFGQKLIISEGVFGMDGDIGQLNALIAMRNRHQAHLFIDDAHGIGVLGSQGRGVMDLFNVGSESIDILTGTLGKAFGTFGAFVAASRVIIDTLVQRTRTYLYTTAIPPALASASLASLELIQSEPERRDQLMVLIAYFRHCSAQLNIKLSESVTPIQPILLGCPHRALTISKLLLKQGILVKAIRPPTVPNGSARLRISLTSDHTKSDVDLLLETLSHALKQS